MSKKKKSLFDFLHGGNAMWIGIVLSTSIWMFILGIFVGRGTAPIKFDIEKLQKELIALKETVIREEKERFKIYTEAAQNKTNLDFYEELKTSETSNKTQNKETKPIPKHQDKTIQQTDRTPETSATIPSQEMAGHYTIQISALRDRDAANKMVMTLKKQGFQDAYITTGNIPGMGIWHRVRIGSFADKGSAETVVKRLEQEEYHPFIVQL